MIDAENARYPRVLILLKRRLSERDNSGASVGKWFGAFPRESLAQVHSNEGATGESVVARDYCVGGRDRRLGWLFDKVKKIGLASGVARISITDGPTPSRQVEWLRRVKRYVVLQLVSSGLWEMIFAPRMSTKLWRFIESFRPELLYVQPGDLTFVRMALAIHRRYGTPLCVQVSDDFPAHLYGGSRLSALARRHFISSINELFAVASLRFGTGERMRQEYLDRYGVEFEPMMLGDEPARFLNARSVRYGGDDEACIVYSGDLGTGRWRCVADLSQACLQLSEAARVRIDIFSPGLPADGADCLKSLTNCFFHDAPSDAAVPGILKGADILFLPESFDKAIVDFIRLSISTKAHLYMMAARPVLAYGGAGAGVIEYATTGGWALVVQEPDVELLSNAVDALLKDRALVSRLLAQAEEVALENHRIDRIRSLMLSRMNSVRKDWSLIATENLGKCPGETS